MTNLQSITNRINSFDYYYEMSDDNRKYSKGRNEETSIKRELEGLSNEELIEVRNGLTVSMEKVSRYFSIEVEETTEEHTTDTEVVPSESKTVETSVRSEIFYTAWTYFKNNLFNSFSEALKAAWRRFKILRALRKGLAYFSFRKANGELREAIGTLRQGNYIYQVKGTEQAESRRHQVLGCRSPLLEII